MAETIVGWHFCAAHQNPFLGGETHGHSYEVRVAFSADPARDAEVLQVKLRETLKGAFDHKTLPDNLSRAEDIAKALAHLLGDCLWVEIWRPLERLGARWCA